MNNASSRTKVWDLPTRLFHWILLLLVGFSWWSGETGGNAMQWHMWSGYAILTLILFRVIWGLVGSETARFTHFLRGPSAILAHVRTLRQRSVNQVIGHNPLGGLMVMAMLLVLMTQVASGLFANDDIANEGPLAHRISKALSDQLTGVHDISFSILLGLVGLHVIAVLLHLLVKKDNLVRPMLTGWRDLPAGTTAPLLRFTSHWLGLLVLAACIGLVVGLLHWA